MSESLTIKLTTGALLKKTMFSIGLLVFTSLYTIVDSLFISNFVNTTALAALNISLPVISIVGALNFMISSGGVAWVSIKLGTGEKDEANKDFSLIILFGFVFTTVVSIILLLNLKNLIPLLGGKDKELYDYVKNYLSIILLTSPIFFLQVNYQSFLFVDGHGKLSLRLTIASGLANIVFDYIFISLCHLGIGGAALGTSVGYFITALPGTIYFFHNKKGLYFKQPSKNKKVIIGTFSNGVSEMITNLASAITTLYFNFLTLKFAGTEGVAAISIILYCQFLFSSVFFGFCMGASPLIGYGWGAQKFDYTKKLLKLCLRVVSGFSVIMFIISFSQAELITGFFCRTDNPVYALGVRGLRLFSFSFLFCGVSIFVSNAFTALGDGKRSGFISFIRVFFFELLFLTIFPNIWGLDGVWLAVPGAEGIMLIINAIFISNLYKRINRMQADKII